MDQKRANTRALIIGAMLVVLIAGLIVGRLTNRPIRRANAITIATPPPTPTPHPTPTPAPIRVYVSGAVAHPDVYQLPPGSIVKDAVEAAGGTTAEADLAGINLALELADQQQVHVPAQGEVAPPPINGGDESAPNDATGGPIDINTASAEALETLPGIGPKTAERIIAHRTKHGPFATVEALQDVSGIGPATFEDVKDLITVSP